MSEGETQLEEMVHKQGEQLEKMAGQVAGLFKEYVKLSQRVDTLEWDISHPIDDDDIRLDYDHTYEDIKDDWDIAGDDMEEF